jgi:hypothetical protein
MPRKVSDLVNRRIAIALILALLVQSLLPGPAMALAPAPSTGETLLICTEEGLKEVILDHGSQQGDVPQAQPCCPCAILCGACALAPVDSLGARVAYGMVIALHVLPDATMPVAARLPPHQSRAPPSSS